MIYLFICCFFFLFSFICSADDHSMMTWSLIINIMSTFQHTHSNGFSPTLLSPSSTSNTTITNNHILLFDNSDQGSVDSDYTSLGSSKFYGNGGSTSSLHRQGRSQSIDELASSTTTTIPTRHFNGTLNVNKLNNDPLQFVKIHPNHDLIERAQEQLTLLESRKRLQENFKLNHLNHNHQPSNSNKPNDDDDNTDWSKVILRGESVSFSFDQKFTPLSNAIIFHQTFIHLFNSLRHIFFSFIPAEGLANLTVFSNLSQLISFVQHFWPSLA